MQTIELRTNTKIISSSIQLDGSKSISNRLLIINALSQEKGQIIGLSTSDDSKILKRELEIPKDEYDVGHAGTSFRFLTSYLAIQSGTQILTGSSRMKQRPVGPLVEALNSIGANIEYLEEYGYPPLKINAPKNKFDNTVAIDASISSQFISALLLIAPVLSDGLTIELKGKQVSTPYIKMTCDIMESCGIKIAWNGAKIKIFPGEYQLGKYKVEADWSAASYYYSLAAFSTRANIHLKGLFSQSLQGDKAIVDIAAQLGILTNYVDDGIEIIKKNNLKPALLEVDFVNCPDIAQTVMVMVAGLGINGLYWGMETLKIKETNRIEAMKIELEKIGVELITVSKKLSEISGINHYISKGKANTDIVPLFDTYKDHRMAMSLAPLSLLFDIKINNPDVVSKSYPKFWEDLDLIL